MTKLTCDPCLYENLVSCWYPMVTGIPWVMMGMRQVVHGCRLTWWLISQSPARGYFGAIKIGIPHYSQAPQHSKRAFVTSCRLLVEWLKLEFFLRKMVLVWLPVQQDCK